MKSLWRDEEAAAFEGALGPRVYTSRLLGRDHRLVLHGGGNTSVKVRERSIFGEDEDILYVKGSGWDLETIEAAGFAPVRLERALRLASLPRLSDVDMVRELRAAMTDPSAPTPSVETLLHALLPFRYVDHTHADALLAITNTPNGEERVREIYGESVIVVPYVMPGFDLARVCAEALPRQRTPRTIGMVLLKHGVFSFGETARESYERMLELVTRAEDELDRHAASATPLAEVTQPPVPRQELAELRRAISSAAGAPMILSRHADPRSLSFARRPDVATLSQQGPATPDHVIRTKRLPMLGRDADAVDAYVRDYGEYFRQHASSDLRMLDPAPRVVLDPELGLCTAGRTPQEAAIAYEVYAHTIDIILRAAALGGYVALPAADIFAVEYWDLEQAKLTRGGAAPVFAGEAALVTGAASGIGKACVHALLRRGAAVVGLDLNPDVAEVSDGPSFLGVRCDVTDDDQLERAMDRAVAAFGGLDMLVLNAGIFGATKRIDALDQHEWRRVMQVNLDANLAVLRTAYPLLRCAPRGGRVVVIGSKNVPAPGPGAAAYSASKAALTQLARVAALEWGNDGIRVNVIHPNAVFDTGIWTEDVLRTRAASYGLTVEQYKKNNVLHVEITSRDVAELAAEMCGPLFARTTGAQVPVDGGNDRVI